MLDLYEGADHNAVSCLGDLGCQPSFRRKKSDFGDNLLYPFGRLDVSAGGLEAGSLLDEPPSFGN